MKITSTVLQNGVTYGNVDFNCDIEPTDDNNCSIRSLASAFKVSYKKAYYAAQAIWNREDNLGIYGYQANQLDQMTLWGKKSERMGEVITKQSEHGEWEVELFSDKTLGKWYPIGGGSKKFRRMSVGTFFKTYNEGSYILVVNGHMFAFVDGEVRGNYSDAIMLKRPIESAYKIN